MSPETSGEGNFALPYPTLEAVTEALAQQAYLPDDGLATAIFLAGALGKPLLLEGEAGVGKTEVAKVLAASLSRRLIRLQCYEGIDASQALYEWDYARQIVATRSQTPSDLFGTEYLVERPLLEAIKAGDGAVLLIDELDRADDEFEAFLLEVLSEFAVTIPEIGEVAAPSPPLVVITSNRTRELHDALKRRCLYHWIEHPDIEREISIVLLRAPEVQESLARSVAEAVARFRAMDIIKRPGVAESIDWARALNVLGASSVGLQIASDTLGAVLKDHEDVETVRARLTEVFASDA